MRKKFIFICFSFIILFNILSSFVFADVYLVDTSNISTLSPVCLLMEAKTGEILYEKNGYEVMYPASTTKLMTAILTIENCNLDDVAKVSHGAVFSVPWDYTNAALQVDEELSIEDLLNVLLIPSANDAGFVLAEHIAGSTESFASMMNSKAQEIGCKNTHFTNPSGIHNDDHYSTAYDLALIGRYAMQYEEIRNIVCKTNYRLPATAKYVNDDRYFVTTNSMLRESYKNYYDERVTGLKTGYTEHALDCIVATAEQDDMNLICVILNAGYTEAGLRQKYLDCRTLFDFGFENYEIKNVVSANDVYDNIKIDGATKETENLNLLYKDSISAFVPKTYDISYAEKNIVLKENIKAPINSGDVIGKIDYTINEHTYSTDLIAASNVEPFPWMEIFIKIGIAFALILILMIIIRLIKPKKKKYRRKHY